MINNDYDLDSVAGSGATKGNYSRIDWRKETEHIVRLLPGGDRTFHVFSRHWVDNRPILSPCQNDPMTVVGYAARDISKKMGKENEAFKFFAGYPNKQGVASQCRVETLVAYNAILRPALPADTPEQGYVLFRWKQHTALWDSLKKMARRKAERARKVEQETIAWSMFDPEAGCDLIVGYYPDTRASNDQWTLEFDEQSPIGIEDWEEKKIDLEEEINKMTTWSVEELAAYVVNKFDVLFSEHTDTTVTAILAEAGYDV